MSDKSQQTEKPTQRRLEKARGEGRFPASREFVGAVQFLGFTGLISMTGAAAFHHAAVLMRWFLGRATLVEVSPASVSELYSGVFRTTLLPMLSYGAALTVVSFATQMTLSRFGLAFNKLAPDLNRSNPMRRLRELPGQNLPAALQALLLLPVFFLLTFWIIRQHLPEYLALPRVSTFSALRYISGSWKELLWRAALLLLVFGAFDLFRQFKRYQKSLRMSKQEVRDEVKETEGNQQIKGRIRRLQRDAARRNMMKAVAKASAVIVNPTHFAVALQYDVGAMAAPRVVAKGKNYIARRIRELALAHQVPIVENPPLAQALYKNVDVGQEIPAHLYRAVAEILAYIHRLMQARRRP